MAVAGHFVTAVADSTIRPGNKVIISGSTAGQVVTIGAGDQNLVVGIYWGKEGGTIAKATSTPFDEAFTDGADFPPSDAADGDVVEIQLVDN